MSTLIVTNISDGTVSVPATVVTEAGVKALTVYNQVTPSTIRSYNVSSVTDTTTGDAMINHTNNFDAADYSNVHGCQSAAVSHNDVIAGKESDSTTSTSQNQVRTCYAPTAAYSDLPYTSTHSAGDLA